MKIGDYVRQLSEHLNEIIKRSIDRIKAFEPNEGYYVAFSGGKDSTVIKALCDMSGAKYKAYYNVTGVDPPELVRFIREYHPDVIWNVPEYTLPKLIIKKQCPPTKVMRYCCQLLKEEGGYGRVVMTGSRWAESIKRATGAGVVTIFDSKSATDIANGFNAEYQTTRRGG